MSAKVPSETEVATSTDVHEIMARIRSMVAEKLATPREKFQPLTVDGTQSEGNSPAAGELLHSPELRLINQRHAYSLDLSPARIGSSHRTGLIGRCVTAFKRKLLIFLRDAVLSDYFKAEHEFQSSVTQYLNALTRYIDQRDSAVFWKLVHKIDVDCQKSVERIDRIADELEASLAQLKRSNAQTLESHSIEGRAHGESLPLNIQAGMTPQMINLVEQMQVLQKKIEALASSAQGPQKVGNSN